MLDLPLMSGHGAGLAEEVEPGLQQCLLNRAINSWSHFSHLLSPGLSLAQENPGKSSNMCPPWGLQIWGPHLPSDLHQRNIYLNLKLINIMQLNLNPVDCIKVYPERAGSLII